jgi:hypothetical protein
MTLEVQRRFSLARHAGAYESWPKKTRLYCEGLPTGTEVEGYVIEAQYRCAHGHLLVTSFDCAFEESNSFTLLDQHFQVLATTQLLVPYGSFLLHAHWPLDDNTLQLHYEMRRFYRLRIRPPGGLLRRHHSLTLSRDDRAWSEDPRAGTSVRELERRLAALRAERALVDAVPVMHQTDGDLRPTRR